jgi:hypothetical protein
MDSLLNGKRLTDRFGTREAPAVDYPASVVGSWKSRVDVESASSVRRSMQAADELLVDPSASTNAGEGRLP